MRSLWNGRGGLFQRLPLLESALAFVCSLLGRVGGGGGRASCASCVDSLCCYFCRSTLGRRLFGDRGSLPVCRLLYCYKLLLCVCCWPLFLVCIVFEYYLLVYGLTFFVCSVFNSQFLGEARCAPQERPATYFLKTLDEVRCIKLILLYSGVAVLFRVYSIDL